MQQVEKLLEHSISSCTSVTSVVIDYPCMCVLETKITKVIILLKAFHVMFIFLFHLVYRRVHLVYRRVHHLVYRHVCQLVHYVVHWLVRAG